MRIVTAGLQVLLALALAAAAVAGGLQSVRMTKAYGFAADAKAAKDRDDLTNIVRYCESANALYPDDHYVCILAADICQRLARTSPEPAATGWYLDSGRWCKQGLALNPYRSEIRVLKTRLLIRESKFAAIDYWREYLDWNWWVPYNHAVMIGLYINAGDPDSAQDHLVWVRDSEYGAECRRLVGQALLKDLTPPAKTRQIPVPKPAARPKPRPER